MFFLAAELIFRVLPDRFFLAMDQNAYEVDGTMDYSAVNLAIELLPAPDVLIIGTSRAREGIHSPILARELRKLTGHTVTVRNYATAAGRVDVWLALIERLMSEDKLPRVLVIALDATDLRDASASEDRYRLIDLSTLPGDIERNGWPTEGDMTHVIGNALPLRMVDARPAIHYRVVRRGPASVRELIEGNSAFGGVTAWGRAYEARAEQGAAPRAMVPSAARLRRARSAYSVTERGLQRLHDLIDLASAQDLRIVLVEAPASPPVREAPNVDQAQARLRAEVLALAERGDVWAASVPPDSFGKRDFRDLSHLNARGALRLVRQITPVVREALATDEMR